MGMKQHPALIDEALAWVEQLRSGEGESETFFDWLTESPRRVEVFLQALALHERLTAIRSEQWDALEATATDAAPENANVVPLRSRGTVPVDHSSRRSARWKPTVIAAGLVVLCAATWLVMAWRGGSHEFTTSIGEQRTIQLEDGSVVNLNTGTHVEVRMSAHARDIRLIEGEALFKVQRDNTRPFRVHAGDAVIEAIGTQFNVYRQHSATVVSVVEGRVQVAANADASGAEPAALAAGEQVDIEQDGHVKRRSTPNIVRATAWQQRRLIFDEEPLANIALEFNRYNRAQFEIRDPQAGARRFSGIFDADDPESLAQLLARDAGLTVEREKRRILVRTR
jgi:transmembrane sensor